MHWTKIRPDLSRGIALVIEDQNCSTELPILLSLFFPLLCFYSALSYTILSYVITSHLTYFISFDSIYFIFYFFILS